MPVQYETRESDRTSGAVRRMEEVGAALGEFFARIEPLADRAGDGPLSPEVKMLLESEVVRMRRILQMPQREAVR